MKSQNNTLGMMVALLALLITSTGLFAQVTPPGRINYQGVLRDASGNPINGSIGMTFRFYGDAVGTLLWEETFGPGYSPPTVTVTGGLFTLALGDPAHRSAGSEALFANVFAGHVNIYLGVTVGADPEMTPRIPVISAPYALNSDTLDGRHASSFMDASLSATFLDTSATSQTKAAKLTLNGAADYGINASGPTAGGRFQDSNNSGYAIVGTGDFGIQAFGNGMGGFFGDLNSSGYAFVGSGDHGIEAYGTAAGGFFADTDSASNAYVGYGNYGIQAYGPWAGGVFSNSSSGYANVGTGNEGIEAYGNAEGGYFQDTDSSGLARVACGDNGIEAFGTVSGGYFKDSDNSGYANVGSGDWGIIAHGNDGGGYFTDLTSGDIAWVGYDTYKILGNGAVNFVQNHPTKKDKVIVYTAPEGDEVATYTRGTAKLVNGEARVKLGETFKWVTNPDIGLTAHITPKTKDSVLYVESVSTSELVVKAVKGFAPDAAFDYLVYGLRIGFEESSIVQEKQQESYIPSFKNHRERYAKYPELRAYNSLERFKSMENAAGLRAAFDFSASQALRDAIHEYDPATDPPVEKLFGLDHGTNSSDSAQRSLPPAGSTPPPSTAPPAAALQRAAQVASESAAQAGATPAAQPPISTAAPRFPLSEPVEAGDVLVMDPHQEGRLMACHQAADARLVGVAMEASSEAVPVTVSGIVLVNVDANYAPVHPGDWLTTSPTPGHAMRTDALVPGTIVGKALGSLDSGTGLVQVLVMIR